MGRGERERERGDEREEREAEKGRIKEESSG